MAKLTHRKEEIERSEVPPSTFLGAEKMRRLVAKELGLNTPWDQRIKTVWIKPSIFDDYTGIVRASYPNYIFVSSDLNWREAAKTVAHECRHIWQMRNGHMSALKGVDNPDKVEAAEQDALRFERYAWRKYRKEIYDDFWNKPELSWRD